ncbi:TorA maturation chaperone TorD [Roseibium hamelinense]|uniref:TorA maturation chaperone TorD n=1 Tax=Roseibium hamelinense TaxID=150831 RepID=A0A562T8K0_9HYPH|nr:molecular chaperone TorD family protein [Roseibium hamelinense]MTI42367.1 molecular chaperone TorD [Roseibium hamelinense]TWI89544.1 TorA maturation chaperone TorD [Roseibium hamelinense]
MTNTAPRAEKPAPEDADRAALYGFLGGVLQSAPNAIGLEQISRISGDDTPIGACLSEIAREAGEVSEKQLAQEYMDLFIGVGRGELVPFGSYYLTGFLNEKPLADLRASMAQLGIERTADTKEPEDHIAALMQMMDGLIRGDLWAKGPLPLEAQQAFFAGHIGNWAPHFFKDLKKTKTSRFYAAVGELGEAFIGVEADAFDMAA